MSTKGQIIAKHKIQHKSWNNIHFIIRNCNKEFSQYFFLFILTWLGKSLSGKFLNSFHSISEKSIYFCLSTFSWSKELLHLHSIKQKLFSLGQSSARWSSLPHFDDDFIHAAHSPMLRALVHLTQSFLKPPLQYGCITLAFLRPEQLPIYLSRRFWRTQKQSQDWF